MKKISVIWPFLLIILVSLIPLSAFFNPGIPLTHDGRDHLARIANFYQSLSEGNIIPRWAGNLNWGYGHPILMFLYPLPSYSASAFLFLGASLANSFKIVFAVFYILSGIGMYLWLKNVFNKPAGIAGAILYLFAPYRFIDMYIRGAIGEHVAFAFVPFVFYFLLRLSLDINLSLLSRKAFINLFLGSLSLALLILSHNAITIMFLPLVIFYSLFLGIFSKRKVKALMLNFLTIIMGFILSSFFLLPAFLEGKYTLRDIVTGKDYLNHFFSFNRFFLNDWNYGGSGLFSLQLGWVHVTLVFLGIFFTVKLFKENRELFFLSVFIFLYFLASLFLMSSISIPVWKIITILQKFQFPWRFLALLVFTGAFIGAIPFYFIKDKKKSIISLTIPIIAIFFIYSYQWKANGFLNLGDRFYKGVYNGTTDTGESAPIWSVRFMEKRPKAHIEFITGEGTIKTLKRTSTVRSYKISVSSVARIKENTLYFPGWKVFVDGKAITPQFQDPRHRGLMTFNLSEGVHGVDIIFRENKLRIIADFISLIGLLFFIFYGSIVFLKKNV